MANHKKILIVDDDFETALFLRTTLEIILPDYNVVNVPSGEEGMLQSTRGVDLVITDLNLPDLSGFSFISWLRHTVPDTPIILVTGERSPQLHEEARSLGITGSFLKPIHVEELVSLVRQTLTGRVREAEAAVIPRWVPAGISRRLNTLRIDTGAHYAMLVDADAKCLAEDGQPHDLDRDRIAALLATNLSNWLKLAQALRAPQPFTISYQAGAVHDLYTANVGANHSVALVFDSQRGQNKIGAVWVFARQAVQDLLDLLADMEIAPTVATESEPEAIASKPASGVEPREPVPDLSLPPGVEPDSAAEPALAVTSEVESLSPAPEEPHVAVPEEVEAFWNGVLSQGLPGDDDAFRGLSLDEAQAQGLIPPDVELPV